MNFKKLPFLSFILLVFISAMLTGCTPPTDKDNGNDIEPVTETAFLMGTIAKITIYEKVEDKQIFQQVFDRILEIEDRMTINKATDKSEIIQLNELAGKKSVKLSPDTFYVLEKGKYYSEISKGRFDITIGPLVKLWNITPEQTVLPDEKEIVKRLPLINHKDLILDNNNLSARLNNPGMIVDLGGIAKGYAADEAARILREAGYQHAIINLGGNVLTLNTKPDGSKFRLGLQDPYHPRGDYMGIVKLDNQALVSSGTYERYFEIGGSRYHHILNPKTGYPEDNSLVSVSIITKESIDADALSTAIFLLGLEEGMQMIEELSDTEAIFITADKKVYITRGISTEVFEITKPEYQIQE